MSIPFLKYRSLLARHSHEEAELLLPWYANGSLRGTDHRRVHRHLCRCSECQAEFGQLAALSRTLAHAPAPTVSTEARNRLMAVLERVPQEPCRPPPTWQITAGLQIISRLGSWLGLSGSAALKPAMALAGLVLALMLGGPTPTHLMPAYTTLGERAAMPQASARDLRVIFDTTLDRSGVERLAASISAQVVDGPSVSGAYLLRLGVGGLSVDSAVEQLRADPRVLLAAPVQLAVP